MRLNRLNFTSELQAFGFILQIKKPSEQPRTANKWKMPQAMQTASQI